MEKEFWDNRWKTEQLGWDIGHVSSPIKAYVDQLEDKDIRILIPGCGNAYEAEYLHKQGFKNVYVIDISQHALDHFKSRYPDFPKAHLIQGDFFELNKQFDLIIEQTFFCALHPDKRDEYVSKMHELLEPEGKLVGLLFDFPLEDGPPFGGSKEEYQQRFSTHFDSVQIEPSYNSIEPRQGKEFWIQISN